MEVYKKGSRGEKVKQIQKVLGVTADGVFGDKTTQAVKKFQKEHGLYADGIVGTKTLNALDMIMDTDLSSNIKITSGLDIENHYLPNGQYLNGHYDNDYLIIHHTSGHDDPKAVVDYWAHDSLGRVATEFVIGGQRSTDGRSIYDGKIIRSYPEGCQGYHIGKCGSSYMATHSVGIEMCNIGWVKNGKSYVNSSVIPSQIITLKESFKGFKQWHKYSDKQLESLKKLMLYVANRDNIDLHKGLYEWIKKEGVTKAFDFHQNAYNGLVKGVLVHTSIRTDKTDCPPQPELVDLILSL